MICTYCGEAATVLDHVTPYAFSGRLPSKKRRGSRDPGDRTPACSNCNSLLGSKMLCTTALRKAYIAERLQEKHKKLLNSPTWDDEELAELSHWLRVSVLHAQVAKQRILLRIAYAKALD